MKKSDQKKWGELKMCFKNFQQGGLDQTQNKRKMQNNFECSFLIDEIISSKYQIKEDCEVVNFQIGSHDQVIKLLVSKKDSDIYYGSISFKMSQFKILLTSNETFERCLWISLFDNVDDLYDGDFQNDDFDYPRIQIDIGLQKCLDFYQKSQEFLQQSKQFNYRDIKDESNLPLKLNQENFKLKERVTELEYLLLKQENEHCSKIKMIKFDEENSITQLKLQNETLNHQLSVVQNVCESLKFELKQLNSKFVSEGDNKNFKQIDYDQLHKIQEKYELQLKNIKDLLIISNQQVQNLEQQKKNSVFEISQLTRDNLVKEKTIVLLQHQIEEMKLNKENTLSYSLISEKSTKRITQADFQKSLTFQNSQTLSNQISKLSYNNVNTPLKNSQILQEKQQMINTQTSDHITNSL